MVYKRRANGGIMMDLCLPCAMKLKAQGQTVKQTGGRNDKVTCSECGRRRFGTTYEVGDKEEKR